VSKKSWFSVPFFSLSKFAIFDSISASLSNCPFWVFSSHPMIADSECNISKAWKVITRFKTLLKIRCRNVLLYATYINYVLLFRRRNSRALFNTVSLYVLIRVSLSIFALASKRDQFICRKQLPGELSYFLLFKLGPCLECV